MVVVDPSDLIFIKNQDLEESLQIWFRFSVAWVPLTELEAVSTNELASLTDLDLEISRIKIQDLLVLPDLLLVFSKSQVVGISIILAFFLRT